ncbi:MAG: hypothetical protein GC157_17455 [Frankiales bacterium]|nr:hypothetical protein [Frankiales bacterium]
MAAAQALRTPVIVDGLTTQYAQSTANPDGTVSVDQYAGPVRVQGSDGAWSPIDTTLAAAGDGWLVPKAGQDGVAFSPGGQSSDWQTLARSGSGSTAISYLWRGPLPAPEVSGDTARYVAVVPGVDLVLTARNVGFEFSAVFTARPTAPVQLPFAVSTVSGVSAKLDSSGSVVWSSKSGFVAQSSAARMWDARVGDDGAPLVEASVASGMPAAGSTTVPNVTLPDANVAFPVLPVTPGQGPVPVGVSPSRVAGQGLPGSAADVAAVLATLPASARGWVLSPSVSLLSDPATVFPVTVDPTVSSNPDFDTYVLNGDTNDESGSAYLRFGLTGTGLARSFLQFTSSGIANTHIDSASLSLYEYDAPTCSHKSWTVWHTGVAGTGTRWTNQPTWYSQWATSTDTLGYSGSCPSGRIYADVTSLMQSIASSGANTVAMGLRAASETDAFGRKGVYSMSYTYPPLLSVTYHHFPGPARKTAATPAAVVGGTTYLGSLTPSFAPVLSDADGAQVRTHLKVLDSTGTTTLWDGYSGYASPGDREPWLQIPSGILSNNTDYVFKLWGNDGTLDSPEVKTIPATVDTTIPAVSGLSCASSITLGGFKPAAPTSTVACTASTTSGTSGIAGADVFLDGAPVTASVASGTISFTLPADMGADQWHQLSVSATSNTGAASAEDTSRFGFGDGVIDTQAPADASSFAIPITIQAASGVSAVLQYQDPATGTWTTVPDADLIDATGGSVTQPLTLSSSGSTYASGQVTWKMAQTYTEDTVAQVRACLQLTSGADCSTTTNTAFTAPEQVTLDRSGNGSASTTVGPFSVSLLTGSVSLSATDADLPSWAGDVSVGRSYQSYRATQDSIFGKGWTSALPSAVGTDWTRIEDAGDYVLVYDSSDIPVAFTKTGTTYTPDADNTDLTLSYTAGATGTHAEFTLAEQDGTSSTFDYPTTGTAPTGTATSTTAYPFTSSTNSNLSGSTSTYTIDSSGNVTRILAPLPPGVSATSCASGSMSGWVPGCADLVLTYDGNHHVTAITERGYSQAAGESGAAQTQFTADMACFHYDTNGYLDTTWDAREQTTSTGTCSYTDRIRATGYGYDATSHRLTTITPPGLQPWTVGYNGTGYATTVSRTHSGGGTITTTLAYGVDTSNTTGDSHPNLSAGTIATWAPADMLPPVTATAVYPPGANTSDLRDAAITALDAQGRTVFTAGFSGTSQAGWHITTSHYDVNGNPDWSLTAHDRDIALDNSTYASDWAALGLPTSTPTADVADALASKTVYQQLAADGVWDATDTYGPMHLITVGEDTAPGRTHIRSTYGTSTATTAPTNSTVTTTAPTHTVLTTTVGATAGASITGDNYATVSTVTNAYGIPDGSGGYLNDGWLLRTPMQVTTAVPGGTDIVAQTIINSSGQVTEQRQPKSANTSGTAGSHTTQYYGTGDNPNACQSTIWYGQVCKTGPATGSESVTTQTSYDAYLRPTVVADTMGTTTRTTTTTYDNGGQSSLVHSVAITGGAGTAVPSTTFGYDSGTGLVTSVSDGTVSMGSGYDDFGQINATSDGAGGSTAITFDSAGRVDTVTGTQSSSTVYSATYGYDGGTEHRGLTTSVTYAGLPAAITATYDGDGNITTQTLPEATGGGGDVTEVWRYDPAGQPTNLAYTQGGNSFGVTDTVDYDPAGRWADETQQATAWTRTYGYDGAGRLITVGDSNGIACEARAYTFDANSNRTAKTTYPDSGGTSTPSNTCQNSTGGTTLFSSYDTADKPTMLNGVSVSSNYDSFGRTTELNSALTPTGTSVASIDYYTNDLVHYMTNGTTEQYWTLDPAGRLACLREEANGTSDSSACGTPSANGVTDTVNHYLNLTSDSPAWTATVDNSTVDVVSYLQGLDDTDVAQQHDMSVVYSLGDLHGDIVATSSTTAAGSFTSSINLPDEYGMGVTDVRYGWLGGELRSTDALGRLIIMGSRVYDPATGMFLSLDPIFGGNATGYSYPADPVNSFDLSGLICGGQGLCLAGPAGGAYGAAGRIAAMRVTPLSSPSRAIIWGSAAAMAAAIAYTVSSAWLAYERTQTSTTIAYNAKKDANDREHRKNKRKSTKQKHEKGLGRKGRDRKGGEKADGRRIQWK